MRHPVSEWAQAKIVHKVWFQAKRCLRPFPKRPVIGGTDNTYVVKISLIIHNGTEQGKNVLFQDLLPRLLGNPGVYIEAAGAVS